MTQANSAHYDLAQEMVRSGAWRVDPDRGHVIGKRGLPFRRTNSWGYIQIKFRDPRLDLLRSGRIQWADLATRRETSGWRPSYVPTSVRDLQRLADRRATA